MQLVPYLRVDYYNQPFGTYEASSHWTSASWIGLDLTYMETYLAGVPVTPNSVVYVMTSSGQMSE